MIEFYEKLADNIDSTVDETDAEEEDFFSELESDPSKADLMIICQALH